MNIQHTSIIVQEIIETNCMNYLSSVKSDLLSLIQYGMITENEYDLLVNIAAEKIEKLLKKVA